MRTAMTRGVCLAVCLCAPLGGGCFLLSIGGGGSGEPVTSGSWLPLFDGRSLEGWRAVDPPAAGAWGVEDGALVNDPGRPGARGNTALETTVPETQRFDVHLEFRLAPGAESGIVLRGLCEVRLSDSYGRAPSPESCGALAGLLAPSVAAERPAGEWQTLDVTLVDRTVTVVLNGHVVLDRVAAGQARTGDGASRAGVRAALVSLHECDRSGRVEFRSLRWRRLP